MNAGETYAITAISAIAALVLLELVLGFLVRRIGNRSTWLVLRRDLDPPIDRAGLTRFMTHGWDAELGWTRKPNTSHSDIGMNGCEAFYRIGPTGARWNPGFEDQPPQILVYGDSFAFARQVNDDETWTHFLSIGLGANVANFGVGNFGLDQALLRLEREFDSHPAPVVIMAVVPETISRIHAVWKHFNEFHNIFAFKPRFKLTGDKLELVPNIVDMPDKFLQIPNYLETLARNDLFYERRFTREMLHFPYLWTVLRKAPRVGPLLLCIALDHFFGGDRTFYLTSRRKMRLVASLYNEEEPFRLLVALCQRFGTFVKAKGAIPMLVVMPEIFDLEWVRTGSRFYAPLIEALKSEIHVVDIASTLLDYDDQIYTHAVYGGHYSPQANRRIADALRPLCATLLSKSFVNRTLVCPT